MERGGQILAQREQLHQVLKEDVIGLVAGDVDVAAEGLEKKREGGENVRASKHEEGRTARKAGAQKKE